jgi:hypothetical protein
MDLAEKHPVVLNVLRKLFSSKKNNERFIVIAYLRSNFPREFLLEIVSKGVTDRSSFIRWKAAQVCGHKGLKELLPLIESRLSDETNDNALYELKSSIGLLKDGYYLHYTDGHPWLTIKKITGQIISLYLNQEQIDKEGLSAIVEREKNEP